MPIYTDPRSGRLYVQFDYKKQTFKQYLPKGSTRTQAHKLETKMRSDAFFQANGMAPRDEILFEDFVQEYLGRIQHNPNKFQKAEYVLIAAKPFLKGKLLRSIRPADVERFMLYRICQPSMHGRARCPATIWREMSVISALFTDAVKNGHCEINPCRSLTKPAFNNIQDKILDLEDEAAFLDAFDHEQGQTARDVSILVLHTGLSQNDVLGLTAFQINRSTRTLTFTRGKTKRHVVIPLNDTAWNVIEPRLGNGLLFVSAKTGKQLKSIRKAIAGACKRANISPLTIRDLRRTYGTRLDTDEVTKSRLLGHSDTRMLNRYVRDTDRMRTAVENLPKPTPRLLNEQLRIAK